jgi:hypothetical protein
MILGLLGCVILICIESAKLQAKQRKAGEE